MDIFLDHLINKLSLEQGLIVGPAYFHLKP